MYSLKEIREILASVPNDVGAGAFTVLVYISVHLLRKRRKDLSLSNVAAVFGSGFSLLPGVSVMLAGFALDNVSGIEQSYFFLGGLAVVYIGLQDIIKKFEDIPQKSPPATN